MSSVSTTPEVSDKSYERRKAPASSADRARDREFNMGTRCRMFSTFARLTTRFTNKICYHHAYKFSEILMSLSSMKNNE